MTLELHDPIALLNRLRTQPKETDWLEFKVGTFDPESVGQYVSGLANAAMFERQKLAYMVWGVKDTTHEVVGTNIRLASEKKGSEDFLLYLSKYLRPKINIHHRAFEFEGKHVEMLIIEPGYQQPVSFQHKEMIRVSSSLKPLFEFPERQKALWGITSSYSFEESIISFHMSSEEILERFRVTKFLEILGIENRTPANAIDNLLSRKLIRDNMQGGYEVTALLAMCCAKNLDEFPQLRNRGPRVISYSGKDKLASADDDKPGSRGYIVGFEPLLAYILSRIPSEEKLQHGRRVRVYQVPRDAVREFLANSIVHQDFAQPGRPLIEIYSDRVRFINPGSPLIEIERFIDAPPTARNQNFVQLMRHAGYCEDRGSGVDRAVKEIEQAALPPPLFTQTDSSTSVTAFMPKHFADMTPEERVRACFQHAQLLHERNQAMTNGSLRARFGLKDTQISQVSRVIADAIAAGKIKPLNENQAPKYASYVPAYA